MFKNKRFILIFLLETIMPWIVAILGIVDAFLFDDMGDYYRQKLMDKYESTKNVFDTLYRITTIYGLILLIALFIVGVVAFIVMCIRLFNKDEKTTWYILRPLVIWIYSGLCCLTTLIFIFLTIAFTIGMSV